MQSYQMNTVKNLLADTLCEKSNGYIMEQLFERFPTLPELFDASELELLTIKGIGKRKSLQILSALKLARALNVPPQSPYVIKSPQDVVDLMLPELAYLTKEHFVVLFLNTKNQVIDKETISIGSLNSCIVHPREVFKAAVKRSSASIIAVHNHPSGVPQESPEDVQLTQRLVEAGSIIGIELIDHVIICSQSYCSLKEKGLM